MLRLDGVAFGITYTPAEIADAELLVDVDRFWVADDGGSPVAVTGDIPMTMTMPGGRRLDVPGVTWVSVSPTHRRRGLLRRLMHAQLADFAARGQTLSILTASEGGIYRRFGYGPATEARQLVIDRLRARLADPPTTSEVEFVTAEQAARLVPAIHDRWSAATPGALARRPELWQVHLADREESRHGATERFHLLHPDGYAFYRMTEREVDGFSRHTAVVTDYLATTAAAHAQLWHVILGLDLVERITSGAVPLDDPLPYLLTDSRQVRTTAVTDGLWVRPIDVADTLAARTYALELDLVIEVADPVLGDGRYRLQGGPDGATAARTELTPQVVTSVDVLGSILLGGHRLGPIARSGGLRVEDDQVLRRLDLAMLTDPLPAHGTPF